MTDKSAAPKRIWIEEDSIPYYYQKDELHEAGSPVTEYTRSDLIPAMLEASENEAAEWKRQALYHNKKHGELIEIHRQTHEALRRAGRKLAAYAGVCKGDKELPETILPMVRAALICAQDTEISPGHTDMMVTPESLDAWLEDNPLPAEPSGDERAAQIARDALYDIYAGRGMFGINAATDLVWAMKRAGEALAAMNTPKGDVK